MERRGRALARPSLPEGMLVAALVLVQCWAVTTAEEPAPPGRETENQPPVLTGEIPLQNLLEDNPGNEGYHLINLSVYFDDDGGVENLIYNVACQTNLSHIRAGVDGHFLSFTTPTKDWYGQEQFRVRATDGEGLWTESNDFTVRVNPVTEPLRFLALPEIDVEVGSEWFFDLDKYIVDPDYGLEGLCLTTNSSSVRIDGLRLYINYSYTPEEVPFLDRVLLNASNPAGHTEAVLTIKVWPHGNFLNPFEHPWEIVMMQDTNHSEELSGAILGNETPFPKLTWKASPGTDGSSSLLDCSVQVKTTLTVTPARHRYGNGTLTLSATDTVGWTRKCTMKVRIIPVFSPDRIVIIRNLTVYEKQSVGFRLVVDDPNDDLAFWTNSTMFVVSRNGGVGFIPAQKDVGEWRIRFCVTYVPNQSLVAKWELRLTVLNVNDPPDLALLLEPRGGRKYVAGQGIRFECIASDIDRDPLNCTWYSDGKAVAYGMTANYAGLAPGVHYIFVNVSDGEHSITSRAVKVTVEPKTSVEETDYSIILGVMLVVFVLAGVMGVVLIFSNKKP